MDGNQAQTWLGGAGFTPAMNGMAKLSAAATVLMGLFDLVVAFNLLLLFLRVGRHGSRRGALLWFSVFMGGAGITRLLDEFSHFSGRLETAGVMVKVFTVIACVGTALSLPFLVAGPSAEVRPSRRGGWGAAWKAIQWRAFKPRVPTPSEHIPLSVLDSEFKARLAVTMEPLQRYVDQLASEARRAADAQFQPSQVDLATLVRATCNHFVALAGERRIHFSVSVPEIARGQVDAANTETVLLSMLFNAFKFAPANGHVGCRLTQDGELGDLVLEVSDSGPGVAFAEQAHIFDRPAAGTVKDAPHKLLGLGLSASHELVVLQGGSITVGTAPEGGALFTVRLPARAQEQAQAAGNVQRVHAVPVAAIVERALRDVIAQPANPGVARVELAADTFLTVASLRPDLDSLAARVQQYQRERHTLLEATQVAKELAERATRVKGNFLRIMSHELRTPITAMRLQIRLLERTTTLTATAAQAMAGITRSSQRLLDMVDTVLEYARIESGRFEARKDVFSLTAMSEEVVSELKAHADHKEISLETETIGHLPLLCSDARLMRLIAINLVTNAVKFTQTGGVKIRLYMVGETHCFSVADSSPGVAAARLAAIFDPFAQMDDIRHQEGVGSGLGLALVKEMVQALGGTILAESEANVGSTFTVMLPLLLAQPSETPPVAERALLMAGTEAEEPVPQLT
jgi:signal transduction histidine kinase